MANKRTTARYHIHKHIRDKSPAFRQQVAVIIDVCGPAFAKKILWKTLKIQSKGGALTADGSRRRTPGGLYFHLAMQEMTPEQRKTVSYYKRRLKAIGMTAFEREVLIPNVLARRAAHNEWVAAAQAAKAERLAREAAEREQAQAEAAAEAEKAARRKPKPKVYSQQAAPLATRLAELTPPESPSPALPPGLPPSVAADAQQLRSAVDALQSRIAALEAKPPAQQVGLEMTRKLLAKTERQLAALLEAHAPSENGEATPQR